LTFSDSVGGRAAAKAAEREVRLPKPTVSLASSSLASNQKRRFPLLSRKLETMAMVNSTDFM
jgi:hypothetical protein